MSLWIGEKLKIVNYSSQAFDFTNLAAMFFFPSLCYTIAEGDRVPI